MALSKKQQAFVKAYTDDPACGKAEAARRAGYKESRAKITACDLMKHPGIQKEIERRLNKAEATTSDKEVTPETVINEILDVIEDCKSAGPGSWQMTARLKAAELLGRSLKMFTDKIEVGADDKLMELLLAGRKRAGMLSAEVVKAEIVRAQLPAPKELDAN